MARVGPNGIRETKTKDTRSQCVRLLDSCGCDCNTCGWSNRWWSWWGIGSTEEDHCNELEVRVPAKRPRKELSKRRILNIMGFQCSKHSFFMFPGIYCLLYGLSRFSNHNLISRNYHNIIFSINYLFAIKRTHESTFTI